MVQDLVFYFSATLFWSFHIQNHFLWTTWAAEDVVIHFLPIFSHTYLNLQIPIFI